MNKAETLAYNWLTKKLGKTNVLFQESTSPDFILSNEKISYEVKRLYGQTIWFYRNQFKKIKSLDNHCKVIVIEDNNSEPFAIIPAGKLEEGKVVDNVFIKVVEIPYIRKVVVEETKLPQTIEELSQWRGPETGKSFRIITIYSSEHKKHKEAGIRKDNLLVIART